MSHFLSPGSYLPHDAPMLLLEEVEAVTAAVSYTHLTLPTTT